MRICQSACSERYLVTAAPNEPNIESEIAADGAPASQRGAGAEPPSPGANV